MPRNGSGTFSVLNSFSPSTVAASARVNENFADIGTALTGSLPRDGQAPMTGPLIAITGTLGQPAITFEGDGDTGFFWPRAGEVSFVSNGVEILTFTGTGITVLVSEDVVNQGTVTSGTTTLNYDDGVRHTLTQNGSINLTLSNIPDQFDLQATLYYTTGTLTVVGVTRWSITADQTSTAMADTGVDPAALVAGAAYQFIFSKIGADTVGRVSRVR